MESLKTSLTFLAVVMLACLFPSMALAQASGLKIVTRVLETIFALRRHPVRQ